jgi:uncharacterized protein YbjT (DUF2867 family)
VKVVVFGATGTVGEALLPELAREHDVTAVSRSAEEGLRDGIMWKQGDVADSDSLDRALKETERRLAAGPVPVTTLRAGMVVGKGSAAFETIAALVDRLPAMILPRWAKTPTQPIALDDVVRYLARVCGNAAAFGQTYDVAGPDVMSYAEMISRISRLKGKAPYLIEVPVLTPWLSALWIELVTPARADVARPLVEGLRNPTVATEERIRGLIPFELTRFDDAARAALSEPPAGQ